MADTSKLLELAAAITKAAVILNARSPDGSLAFLQTSLITDFEARNAKLSILQSCHDLSQLVRGPLESIQAMQLENHADTAVLDALVRLDIITAVPPDGTASLFDISKTTSLPEALVTRLLRYATAAGVFVEGPTGVVSHTDMSRLMLPSAPERSMLDMGFKFGRLFDERLCDAFEKWGPDDGEPNHTAFNLAFDTDGTIYQWFNAPGNEWAHDALWRMLSLRSKLPEWNEKHVLKSSVWGSLPPGALVVDVGGGEGSVSALLAEHHPEMRFVVQDKAPVIDLAEKKLPARLRDRISLEVQDFFEQQPTHTAGADVYMLRLILHNWSDKYCGMILRNIVTAMEMKPGSRLVVVDTVLPTPGSTTKLQERRARTWDMRMLTFSKGAERDREAWERLFEGVDQRLHIASVESPEGSSHSIITVQLKA